MFIFKKLFYVIVPTCYILHKKIKTDFAVPFEVKAAMIRKIKITKAYICIFICMTTTAIHIELVSDLSIHPYLSLH